MQTVKWPSGRAKTLRLPAALMLLMGCQNGPAAPEVPSGTAPSDTALAPAAVARPAPQGVGGGLASGAASASAAPALQPSAAGALEQRPAVDVDGIRGTLAGGFLDDVGDGWRNQLSMDWELPAGREQYLCARLTATQDVYYNGLRPLNPRGTHHVSVSILDVADGPDGVSECDVNDIGTRQLGGSGVGTTAREFPDGVAMKIDHGTQLILNLHLFNLNDEPLRGRSGSYMRPVAPENVKYLADAVVAASPKLVVPPGHSVQRQTCTVSRDYTVMSLFPHMHQTGVHMKVVSHRASQPDLVLHDAAYDFEQQVFYRVDSLAVKKGDRFDIECTYDNPTNHTLRFGESSLDEMCVLGLGRYPAGGESACPQ